MVILLIFSYLLFLFLIRSLHGFFLSTISVAGFPELRFGKYLAGSITSFSHEIKKSGISNSNLFIYVFIRFIKTRKNTFAREYVSTILCAGSLGIFPRISRAGTLTTVFGFVLDKNSGQQKSRPKSAFY
jgi:hypothetical protein